MAAVALVVAGDTSDSSEATILHGDFIWTGAGESGRGDLESSFTATSPGKWKVSFRFTWRGKSYTYAGTAEGSLTEGLLEGKVKNGDKTRNFTFSGVFKDGVFTGSHTEVGRGRPGRIEQTGTMTLRH